MKVQALTRQQIVAQTTPDASQPEAIPGVLYDTLQWPIAGPAGALRFFQQNNPTPEISNVKAGRLDAGFDFKVAALGCDILAVPSSSAGVIAGALNDIELILKSNLAFFTFSINNKAWPTIPLTFAHASGGATGIINGSYTAPIDLQAGNNGIFDGGFATDGNPFIRQQAPFIVTVDAVSPRVAISANVNIRFWMRGTWYRPVV